MPLDDAVTLKWAAAKDGFGPLHGRRVPPQLSDTPTLDSPPRQAPWDAVMSR